MRSIYLALQVVLLLPFAVWFLTQAIRREKYRHGIWQRLGFYPHELRERLRNLDRPVWLHAVSVGEFIASQPLIAALQQEFSDVPVVVSTTTLTGQRLAKERLFEKIPVFYFPLDFSPCVKAAFGVVRPRLLLLMETEIWPGVLFEAQRTSVPVLQINGRLSDKSAARMALLKPLLKPVMNSFSGHGVQTEDDGERLSSIGVDTDKVEVTGNMKYEQAVLGAEQLSPKARRFLDELTPWKEGPLLVFGSTHSGEDKPLLKVYRALQDTFPALQLIIAPRHPERGQDVLQIAEKLGISAVRRSETRDLSSLSAPVLILDTIGELSATYQLADLVVIAGSFIPHGGQNILEPIAAGKLTFSGPSMENFRQPLAAMLPSGGLIQVKDTGELEAKLAAMLSDLKKAQQLGLAGQEALRAHMGAVERTVEMIRPFLG